MAKITKKLATEKAIEMVLMDAIEKGHTGKNGLIPYMKSETFKRAVLSYREMLLSI